MGRQPPVADPRRLVEHWRISDCSVSAFARARGMHPQTLARWIERHPLGPAVSETTPHFVELTSPEEGFVLTVSGLELRFTSPPPIEWFANLRCELRDR